MLGLVHAVGLVEVGNSLQGSNRRLQDLQKQGLIQSIWDDINMYSSRMIPPLSGLVWGWFLEPSEASVGVKLTTFPLPPPPTPLYTVPLKELYSPFKGALSVGQSVG